MRIAFVTLLFLLLSLHNNIFASQNYIERKIAHIEKTSKVKIGLSAIHIESGRFFHYRSDERFKMASTEKLPIAIYLLYLVEQNKIKLSQMVNLHTSDSALGSGMLRYYLRHPGLSMSVANLLEPMILISDNSTSDAVLRLVGGPDKVFKYLKAKGFEDIYVNRSIMQLYEDTSGLETIPPKSTWTREKWLKWREEASHDTKKRQYKKFYEDTKDTATPRSMTHLLVSLYNNILLTKANSDLLLDIMGRSWDGYRLNKFLPKDAKLVHKTGTWWDIDVPGTNYGYCNDVGIIYLPNNGGHIAISIYSMSDSQGNIKEHAEAVAKVSKLVYDELIAK